MFSRKTALPSNRRATAIAVAAALALTAVVPSVASAGSAPLGKGYTAATGSTTDISARRRGFNPGAAAVAGVVGTGLAIAGAAAASRYYYDDSYGYYGGGGPVYVAPGPYYYGGYGGYGPYGASVPYDQYGHPNAGW
jgi:hypothetical protein